MSNTLYSNLKHAEVTFFVHLAMLTKEAMIGMQQQMCRHQESPEK